MGHFAHLRSSCQFSVNLCSELLHLTALLNLLLLDTLEGSQIVSPSFLLAEAQVLGCSLFSGRELLGDLFLDPFLLGSLLRGLSFSSQQNPVIVHAGFGSDQTDLSRAIDLSNLVLIAYGFDDLLALGSLN